MSQTDLDKSCLTIDGNPTCLKSGQSYQLTLKPGVRVESFSLRATGAKIKELASPNTYSLKVSKHTGEVKVKMIEERIKATREQHETWFVFAVCENE